MTAPVRRYLWFGVALFLAFLAVTVGVVTGWTQPLDDAWRSLMADAEVPWLVAVAKGFHVVGGVPVATATAIVIGVAFAVAKRWRLFWSWVAIVAGAQILSTVVKLLVDRSRPVDALVHESSASYPSGHAMVSGAAIGIGFAVLAGVVWPRRSRLFLGIGITYALLMALSRTYLRIHWLTDVTGGLLLGSAVVALVAGILAMRSNGGEPAVDAGSDRE